MGAVYQAWDTELTEAVAIKVIRPEAMATPAAAREIERRFKRELQLARQVTHRNVIRIHDIGDIGGIKYITMSYVEGTDLATLIKREGTLDVARTLSITRAIVSGLLAAHAAGVVHRDLKPANVMVANDGEAYLMDFGIARSISSAAPAAAAQTASGDAIPWNTTLSSAGATMVGTVLGTVHYMAPEQARGEEVDQRADIYALGLIMYDMLLGRRRQEQATSAIAELEARALQAPPAPNAINPAIPEALSQLVARCLEPAAANRFQTTDALAAELDRLDERGELLPVVRRLTPRLVAVAAALTLVMLGATYWLTRRAVEQPIPHEPVSVAIADFVNTTGDPTLDDTLAQTLRRGLEDASFISAYDRTRIRSTLAMQPPDNLDEVAAREIAVKHGLGVVLAASIGPRGDGFEISFKAVESVSGNVIADVTGSAASADQILEAATRLIARVRRALGDETSESAQLFAMRSVSASSLDVVGHYAAAVEAQTRGQFEEARQRYLKAVELDPTFGLGYQGLAVMSRNLGQLEDSDRYIKEALRYLDGMTERERFATRGFYYRMIGDNQQCATEYGALLARYPADTIAHNQRAICLAKLRNMREATDHIRQAVRMLPNHPGFRTNLALMANLAGEFEAADEEVGAIPQPDVRALLARAYSQTARGLIEEATQTYRQIATMGAAGASSGASGLGDLAVYEGRFAEAARIFEQGAAAELKANSRDRAAIKLTSLAHAHLAAGRPAAAIAAAERALSNSQSMPVRFLAARIFVEAGAVDRARPLAAALSAELPAEPQVHGRIIEGLIALKSGQPREAIRILTEANGMLDTWFGRFDLGRAYLDAGAFPQADSEFERCIARRGEALSLMDEGPTYSYFPFVYYYQGRVREGIGTAGFVDSYREFLRIRADSNEDPLLKDVQERILKVNRPA
jgi:tetratricopeptide (TPR) repeat protein/tRNA A-37 threonylcarbamoyl transferase component Bud32